MNIAIAQRCQVNPQELSAGRFARQMALFYASTFVALGVHLPFLPVWLAAKGLEAQTIGMVLALPMILRLFVIPAGDAGGRSPRRAAGGDHGRRAGGADRVRRARLHDGTLAIAVLYRAGGDRLHAAVRPVRRLCAARARAAPARLRAGAAVGLGRLHRRQSRGRLSARLHRRPRPDLADRRRHGALPGRGLGAAAARRAAGGDGRRRRRPRACCCAIPRSSRSPRRRA